MVCVDLAVLSEGQTPLVAAGEQCGYTAVTTGHLEQLAGKVFLWSYSRDWKFVSWLYGELHRLGYVVEHLSGAVTCTFTFGQVVTRSHAGR